MHTTSAHLSHTTGCWNKCKLTTALFVFTPPTFSRNFNAAGSFHLSTPHLVLHKDMVSHLSEYGKDRHVVLCSQWWQYGIVISKTHTQHVEWMPRTSCRMILDLVRQRVCYLKGNIHVYHHICTFRANGIKKVDVLLDHTMRHTDDCNPDDSIILF